MKYSNTFIGLASGNYHNSEELVNLLGNNFRIEAFISLYQDTVLIKEGDYYNHILLIDDLELKELLEVFQVVDLT